MYRDFQARNKPAPDDGDVVTGELSLWDTRLVVYNTWLVYNIHFPRTFKLQLQVTSGVLIQPDACNWLIMRNERRTEFVSC